jgi:hypothetical protein
MAGQATKEIEKGGGVITGSGATGLGANLTVGVTRFGIGLASRITEDPKDTIRLMDLRGAAYLNAHAGFGTAWVEGRDIQSAKLGAAGVVGLVAEGIDRADVIGFGLGAKARLGIDFMGAQKGDFQLAWVRAGAEAGFSLAGGMGSVSGGRSVHIEAPGNSLLEAEGAIGQANLSGFEVGANLSASLDAGLAKVKGVKVCYAEPEATAEFALNYGSGSVSGELNSVTIRTGGGTFVQATA